MFTAAFSSILRSLFLFCDLSQDAHFLGHVAVDRSCWILCLSLLCVRCTFLSGCVLLAQSVLRCGITGQELLLAICSEQLTPVSFASWCMVGFLDLGVQRVLPVVGTCRARLLQTMTVLFHSHSCLQDGPARHQNLCYVEPKLERDRGAILRLNNCAVSGVTSRVNAASERFVVMSVLGLAVTFLQIL